MVTCSDILRELASSSDLSRKRSRELDSDAPEGEPSTKRNGILQVEVPSDSPDQQYDEAWPSASVQPSAIGMVMHQSFDFQPDQYIPLDALSCGPPVLWTESQSDLPLGQPAPGDPAWLGGFHIAGMNVPALDSAFGRVAGLSLAGSDLQDLFSSNDMFLDLFGVSDPANLSQPPPTYNIQPPNLSDIPLVS